MELSDQMRANLEQIQLKIDETLRASGRKPGSVALVAVSKKQPVEKIEALYALGHRDFGENYVQELEHKAKSLAKLKDLRWHYIGHIQSNKIKTILRYSRTIHALSNIDHAMTMSRLIEGGGLKAVEVFLALRPDGEDQKSGFSQHEILSAAASIAKLPGLNIRGLMCVPPSCYQDPVAGALIEVPEFYKQLGTLSQSIGQGELSLGMSGDLQIAVRAGSTCLRIGSSIFGKRQ